MSTLYTDVILKWLCVCVCVCLCNEDENRDQFAWQPNNYLHRSDINAVWVCPINRVYLCILPIQRDKILLQYVQVSTSTNIPMQARTHRHAHIRTHTHAHTEARRRMAEWLKSRALCTGPDQRRRLICWLAAKTSDWTNRHGNLAPVNTTRLKMQCVQVKRAIEMSPSPHTHTHTHARTHTRAISRPASQTIQWWADYAKFEKK